MFVVPGARAPEGVMIAGAGFTVMVAVVTDLDGSLMLVAVTVTVEATVPVAVRVVLGVLPVAVAGFNVPAPVTLKVAPEALLSFATAAARASVCPESSVIPEVTVENETAMGVRVMVREADLVGSLTLVAVTTAEVAATGFAEVKVVAMPLAVVTALNEPPPVTDQVTPALDASLATVAVKACVAPPIIAAGVLGAIATETGFRVIAAVVDLVGSLMLVAVSVTAVTAVIAVLGAL